MPTRSPEVLMYEILISREAVISFIDLEFSAKHSR